MSDERLRELERRWKETGAVKDEAAFLLERVRAGQLPQERLELAARLGVQAANTALGRTATKVVLDEVPVTSAEEAVRMAVAAARVPMPYWLDKHKDTPIAAQAREAIERAEKWALCPCERHSLALLDSVVSSMPHWWARLGELLEHPERVSRVISSAIRSSSGLAHAPSSSVIASIQAEFVPWILGYRDPLAERE